MAIDHHDILWLQVGVDDLKRLQQSQCCGQLKGYINIMKAMNYIATINCIELFLYP